MRAALAAAGVAFAAAAHAGGVAFVSDLKGSATIEGNGKLTFLHELAPGTRLLLGTNAAASITYAVTGSEFAIAGPGEFSIGAAEVKADKGKAPVKRAVPALGDPGVITRMSHAATASVRMRGITPGTAATVLEYPVDARIATLQPVLRWKGDMSTEGVLVRVNDSGGKEIWKAKMLPNSPPPSIKLAPGQRYKWNVLTRQGEVAGEASFETLSAEAVQRAEKSRAAAKTFSDRVLHALLLQELGAAQDAREAWGALARERPDLPELAGLAR